jgi:hypothetical protein
MPDSDRCRSPAAHEGVEDNVAGLASRKDARLNQRGRERGEVGAFVRAGGDGPDAAAVCFPAATCPLVAGLCAAFLSVVVAVLVAAEARPHRLHVAVRLARHAVAAALVGEVGLRQPCLARFGQRLRNSLGVVVIPLRLRQQEDILMRLGAAVAHALGHWVRLVPDDVLAQIPAVGAEGEGQHPGDADQVFRLQSARRAPSLLVTAAALVGPLCTDSALIVIAPAVRAAVRGVAVPNVQPQRAILRQHITHTPKYLGHCGDVFRWRLLQPYLTFVPVVSQAEVRRRSNARLRLDAFAGPAPHRVAAISELNHLLSIFHESPVRHELAFAVFNRIVGKIQTL